MVAQGGLASVQQLLVANVCCGDPLDLIPDVSKDETINQDTMRSWGPSQTCSATTIRDILRGQLAAKPDPHGLRLRGAKITGRLDLENLTTDINLELTDCLLEEGVLARDADLAIFSLAGCQLEHTVESPLDADRLTCSVLILTDARIIGHAAAGAVGLVGARIGSLVCGGADLRNDCGPALVADNLQVDQSIFLRGVTATATGDIGVVNLRGARIGSSLECNAAALRNDSGPALYADNLQVGQNMFLRGFTAIGAGELGTVNLVGAHISGQLDCDGAALRNDCGPALYADNLQVDQRMFLTGGFTAIGAGQLGTVNLVGAHIGSSLECIETALCNPCGPALYADNLQVDQSMVLREFTATSGGAGITVDLARARVGGTLEFKPVRLEHAGDSHLLAVNRPTDVGLPVPMSACGWLGLLRKASPSHAAQPYHQPAKESRARVLEQLDLEQLAYAAGSHRRLAVDGLTYAGVPEQIPPERWLRLLREATPRYAAQPYQHLAAGHRALGADQKARKVLMAQRDDQLARACPSWSERLWGRITKVTLGYGYQPWRALLFLFAVVVLSCVLAVMLGSHGALAHVDKAATQERPCTLLQQVSVGLDLNLPVGTSLAREQCDLAKDSASATVAWLTATGWVLQVLAWVFAALFIAGFTSAVRKT